MFITDYEVEGSVGLYAEVHRIPSGRRYKGGGGGDPPSSRIANTKAGTKARQTLYPLIERGMAGDGITTDALQASRENRAYGGIKTSFAGARETMNSNLSRILQRGDNRPLDYINRGLAKEQITATDNQRRAFTQEKLSDKQTAMGMADATIANEQRMGIGTMQAYNQAAQQNSAMESQMGTFGTNLMGGVGSGMTSAYFAQKWSKPQ